MGLSACAEWILNFVQEIAGVSTDPQGSWFTKHILFLSFLVSEAKTGPPQELKKCAVEVLFQNLLFCRSLIKIEGGEGKNVC